MVGEHDPVGFLLEDLREALEARIGALFDLVAVT